jgi:hypothetical protein
MTKKPKRQRPIPTKFRDKLKLLVRRSPQFKIVQSDQYLYFAVHRAQEEVTYRELLRTPKLSCYSVSNSKQVVVGYFILIAKKPKMTLTEFGAALFYSEQQKHRKLEVLYYDQKLRVLSFDGRDIFISCKWKSNSQEE